MDFHKLLFMVYPYIVLAVFVIGCWIRFDRDQYTWKTDSSQLLERRLLMIASPLFHVGVIFVFFGHFFGLLTPHSWFLALGISDNAHQVLAICAGTLFGSVAWVGAILLLLRRLKNPRVRATTRKMDLFVLLWLLLTLSLGLITIPISAYHAWHGDASTMIVLSNWVRTTLFFQPDLSGMYHVNWLFKLHLLCGLTVFLIFPFTRLVHILSFPIGYLSRPYQIVRSRFVRVR